MHFKPPFYSPPSILKGGTIFEDEFVFDENGQEVQRSSPSCILDLPPRSQYTFEVLSQLGTPLNLVPLTPIVSQPLNL